MSTIRQAIVTAFCIDTTIVLCTPVLFGFLALVNVCIIQHNIWLLNYVWNIFLTKMEIFLFVTLATLGEIRVTFVTFLAYASVSVVSRIVDAPTVLATKIFLFTTCIPNCPFIYYWDCVALVAGR